MTRFRRLSGESNMRYRAAELADADMLLEWRNDPETRAASRTGQHIERDDHLAWMAQTLNDPAHLLLIIESRDESLGTVRWDQKDLEAWEVSITVAPNFRGRGLARSVLAAGEKALDEKHQPLILIATVHNDNEGSKRLFASAGYEPGPDIDDEGFLTYIKRLARLSE